MAETTCTVVENGVRCETGHYGHGMCQKHWARWRKSGDPLVTKGTPQGLTAVERFMRFVRVDEATGCWIWHGSVTHEGYGRFSEAVSRTEYAHAWIYKQMFGPLPEGMQLDHFKCDNRRCANPEHVRAVTPRENALRSNNPAAVNASRTHCVHGHPFTAENTKIDRRGGRSCRICANRRNQEYRRRLAGVA